MKILFFVITFISLSISSRAQKNVSFTISGIYQGKNIYVQNPFHDDSTFCTQEVWVNGIKLDCNLKKSAYEIDLSFLKVQDTFKIKIVHYNDCKPKILNPNFGCRTGHFHFSPARFKVDKDSIYWQSGEASKGGYYTIERFEYNSWTAKLKMKVDSLPSKTNLSSELTHQSGENKYRIFYQDLNGSISYSSILNYHSTLVPLKILYDKKNKKIILSRAIECILLDKNGKEVSKETTTEIDLSKLKTGTYYLNADNKTKKIRLR